MVDEVADNTNPYLGCDGNSMKVETLEGSEIHICTDDLSKSNLLTVTIDVGMQNSTLEIHVLEPKESREFSTLVIELASISALKRVANSLLLCELLEQLKGWMKITPYSTCMHDHFLSLRACVPYIHAIS